MSEINKDKRRYVEATFRVMEAMEDLRDIWRRTAPLYELSEGERIKVGEIIKESRNALNIIEKVK